MCTGVHVREATVVLVYVCKSIVYIHVCTTIVHVIYAHYVHECMSIDRTSISHVVRSRDSHAFFGLISSIPCQCQTIQDQQKRERAYTYQKEVRALTTDQCCTW